MSVGTLNDNFMDKVLEFLKARIEALETELEKVRQEKTFLANELRFCNMQLNRKY